MEYKLIELKEQRRTANYQDFTFWVLSVQKASFLHLLGSRMSGTFVHFSQAQIEKLSVFYRTEFHTTTLNIIIDNLEIYHERFELLQVGHFSIYSLWHGLQFMLYL